MNEYSLKNWKFIELHRGSVHKKTRVWSYTICCQENSNWAETNITSLTIILTAFYYVFSYQNLITKVQTITG